MEIQAPSLDNAGLIQAEGGAGGAGGACPATYSSAGGGGGGGAIYLIYAILSGPGRANVSGGVSAAVGSTTAGSPGNTGRVVQLVVSPPGNTSAPVLTGTTTEGDSL